MNYPAPRSLWRLPTLYEDLEEDLLSSTTTINGLSISEDEKNVYVEASLPGIDPKDIEVTFDKGVLTVSGEKEEEERKKKYYRKASSSFSYRALIPGEVDPSQAPTAEAKNGVMKVTFVKVPESQPKKINVKLS